MKLIGQNLPYFAGSYNDDRSLGVLGNDYFISGGYGNKGVVVQWAGYDSLDTLIEGKEKKFLKYTAIAVSAKPATSSYQF